jgi:hypothetical protein
MVPVAPNFTWPLSIAGCEGSYILTWNSADVLKLPKELALYDEGENRMINMKTEEHFISKNKDLTIFYGDNLETMVKPSQIRISSPFPNPTQTQKVNFTITLPETTKQSSQARLQITNPAGNIIYQGEYVLNTGLQNIIWETSAKGYDCPNGVYFYQINIGKEVVTGKIIIQK